MRLAVIPDTQNELRIRRILGMQHSQRVVGDLQAFVGVAATGIALHPDFAREVGAVAHGVALEFNRVAGDYLVCAEREVDADILEGIRGSDGPIQVARNPNIVVDDVRVVEIRPRSRKHAD